MNAKAHTEKRHLLVREIIETVILALLIFLVVRFAIQNFNIDGTSMEPGLHNAELVLVDKWTYLFHQPARGDVVVFRAPPDPTEDYVKRVIALPGDIVSVVGTRVAVNGVTLKETYVDPHNQGVPPGAHEVTGLTVPPNMYFVLGDNRAVSSDSRIWGFVPRANIIGRAALVYWPLGRDNNGFLPGVSTVFAHVQQSNQQESGPLQAVASQVNALWLLAVPALFMIYLRLKTLKLRRRPASDEQVEQGP